MGRCGRGEVNAGEAMEKRAGASLSVGRGDEETRLERVESFRIGYWRSDCRR